MDYACSKLADEHPHHLRPLSLHRHRRRGRLLPLGDLLEFEPVPVQPRVNGWDADAQRAFIALLATTGSKRQAAQAIGRNPHGIAQLLKREDGASFRLAFDRAMAIAKANGSTKLAQGVADAAARNAQLTPPSRLRGLPDPEPELTMSDDEKWDLMHRIGIKFMRKVAAEREARLAGEIVAADFYLRQVMMMEVMLDLMAAGAGEDAHEVLRALRRGELPLLQIVSTPLSDWMDRARRKWWAEEGEPERPRHPDVRYLERRHSSEGECAIYTDQGGLGPASPPPPGITAEDWSQMDGEQQRLARQKQFEEDAAEQRAYERRAFEEWRARVSAENSEQA